MYEADALKQHFVGRFAVELAHNLRVDSVSRLPWSSPHAIDPECGAAEAAEIMRTHKVGCLLVCEQGKLIGILTEHDLLRRVVARNRPLNAPVRSCMSVKVTSVSPMTSIRIAIHRMHEGGHRHLPIVDESNHPLGLLSVKRIVHYILEHYPTVYNVPTDPRAYPSQPEGA